MGFLITTTSFWMEDVYNLTASELGWYTLSIFIAEMSGSIIMSQISDQYGIFVCSFVAFSIKIIDSLIIFNLAILVGDDCGGLWLAIILNFFLFVGWEMFFITQILAMIEFGPHAVSKNIILLSNFAVASIAKILGAACYGILYKIKDQRIDYTPIPEKPAVNNQELNQPLNANDTQEQI